MAIERISPAVQLKPGVTGHGRHPLRTVLIHLEWKIKKISDVLRVIGIDFNYLDHSALRSLGLSSSYLLYERLAKSLPVCYMVLHMLEFPLRGNRVHITF
jgi:hypothetical protein